MWPFFSATKKTESLGAFGERVAAEHYKGRGYIILSRNEFNRKGLRVGEIDFIARTKHDIAFVEVKTRTAGGSLFGSGAEAVNSAKQRKLLSAVHSFLFRHPEYRSLRPHVDVCVLEVEPLDRRNYSVTIMENSVEDLS